MANEVGDFAKIFRIFRYAPTELALDYCLLGWVPSRALMGTHHGEYSVLVEWKCGCPAREPCPIEGKDGKITTA